MRIQLNFIKFYETSSLFQIQNDKTNKNFNVYNVLPFIIKKSLMNPKIIENKIISKYFLAKVLRKNSLNLNHQKFEPIRTKVS